MGTGALARGFALLGAKVLTFVLSGSNWVTFRFIALPSFGAISLPKGLLPFDARCFHLLQRRGVVLSSQVDIELGMLR